MNYRVFKYAMAVMAGTLATVGLSGCGGSGQQMQMPAPDIATMTVAVSEADNLDEYPAQIKGKTDIDIRPQVSGFITKVCVDEGQRVKKGQTLFVIDQVQYQAAVDNAAAAVNSAKTRVNTAKMTADTKRQLLEKNIISQYEYQLADNDLQTARAALAQAESALVNARKNLSYTTVVSPSDGVVGSIPNREGSLAGPSSAQPLTTVSDVEDVYAYFSLTEKDLLKLTKGGTQSVNSAIAAMPKVQLRLADGSVYPFEGEISTVSGQINTSTGAASVRALFPNASGMLRSGSTGAVLVPSHTDSAIVIPQKATYELQDRRFVYVVGDSNKVASALVTVEPLNDGKSFVVKSGLKVGDRIAIEGVGTKVKEGLVINPVDPAAKEAAQPQQPAGK